jgi:hypothetical protein
MVSEAFVENVNASAIDAPADFDEWSISGLTKEKSACVHLFHTIYMLTKCCSGASKSFPRQGKRC